MAVNWDYWLNLAPTDTPPSPPTNWWNNSTERAFANYFSRGHHLNGLARILSPDANYDYRMFEQVANAAKQFANGHWGDAGKKGNHRTTSNQSDSWKFDRIKDYADGKLTEKQLKQIWNLTKDDDFSWTTDTFGNDVYHALPAQLSDPEWREYMERREAPLGTRYVPAFDKE